MSDLFVLASFVVGLTIRVPRVPAPGETLLGDSFDFGPGGKGFNQAVGARRLGADVDLLMAVGRDIFGDLAMRTLAAEGFPEGHVHRLAGVNTGVGFVTLQPGGENTIVLDPGANMRLTPAHARAAEGRIAAARMLLAPLEVPVGVALEAFRLARKHGVTTMLNPAPAAALPPELLALTDVLTPNETEMRLLLGLAPDCPTPTRELLPRLLELGVKRAVVTRGKHGALVADGSRIEEIPPVRVTPVDTTGAGDCFNAALATGLLAGMPLATAARRSAAAGAYCTQHLGVINGLPTLAQLEDFTRRRAGTEDNK